MTTATDDAMLPEYRDNPFINRLPPLLSLQAAWKKLADPPIFNAEERQYPSHVRAQCIQRLAHYFEPLEHHLELEALFSSTLRQGYISRNPLTTDYIHRLRDGHERVLQRDLSAHRHSVRSTATSFALIGCSGIGKSKAIERVLELYPPTLAHDEPFSLTQVVWLKLDCPYIGSPKQLCISFFREMDLLLGTRYLDEYGGSRASIDRMMAHMAHVANLHALGVLIIDEIQHLQEARGTGSDAMLNFLVTLVNTIGIPVITIGTIRALPLLQGNFRQARRASGVGNMVWDRMKPGPAWDHFIGKLWGYQWTTETSPLTDEVRRILYDESQGILDVVIKLFMLAQLRALQLGVTRRRPEVIDAGLLRHVAEECFGIIRPMIDALKRNDKKAIAKYDDIVPLQDYVQQAFADATLRLAQRPTAQVPKDPPTADDPILGALINLGLAADVAQMMMAEARAENPKASGLDLASIISDKLRGRGRGREAKPVKPSRKAAKERPPDRPDDLRVIVAAGKEAGKSGYQTLLDAGMLMPPVRDFGT